MLNFLHGDLTAFFKLNCYLQIIMFVCIDQLQTLANLLNNKSIFNQYRSTRSYIGLTRAIIR